MRTTTILMSMLTAAALGAQGVPVRPAPAPAPVAPAPAVAPAAAAAPAPSARPMPAISRAGEMMMAEDARAQAMAASDAVRAEGRAISAQARAEALQAREYARAEALQVDEFARAATRAVTIEGMAYAPFSSGRSFAESPRSPWAQQDPADSLYRMAREQLNRGDYRRAAQLFKELPQKYPSSSYAADSPYWQAFALYRIGGTAELQEALAALEAQKAKYPGARTLAEGETRVYGGGVTAVNKAGAGRGAGAGAGAATAQSPVRERIQADASALAARIAGVLSTRGLGTDAAVKRALATDGAVCDREELSVRAEALSALMQVDAEGAQQMTKKILARRDECSVPLRRNAVFIVGNKHDASAAATLLAVAKSDPSLEVRGEAVNWLTRVGGDDGVNALIEMSRSSDDEQLQRAVVRALAGSANARAKAEIHALVERNDASEALRLTALEGLDRDKIGADDAAWLRGLYGKTESVRIKSRIASAVGRLGGEANNQWLLAIAKNEDESMDARMQAINRAGEFLDVASLSKLYDGVSQRPLRESLIGVLGNRKEPEATDKLLDIVKTGTDPNLRRYAINVLSRKKDPRTTKLLMELIEK